MPIGSAGIVEIYLPPGGTAGQVLAKIDSVNYNATWTDGGGGGGIALSAAGSSAGAGTVVFSNSNGITFGMNGSTVTASVAGAGAAGSLAVPGQTIVLGQAVLSNSNNVTFGIAGSTVTASASFAQSVQTQNSVQVLGSSGNISFNNANGVTFGANASTITASVAAQSVQTQGSVQVLGSTGAISFANANGVTFGANASTITASVAAQSNVAFSADGGSSAFQTLSFRNANGISFSNSLGSIQASYTVPAVPPETPFGVSAGTQSVSTGTLAFVNSNGISFGMSGSSQITASHNGLTTARASNDAVGTNTAQSNVTWTVNSAGISLDARGYAGTGTSATNASITLNSNGLAISVAAPGGGGATFSAGVSTIGNTLGNTGTISNQLVLAGGNNITLSGSTNAGGMTLTISGANAGGAQTGISSVIVSDATYTSGAISFSNVNGISFGSSAGQAITASYTVPSTAGLISRINVSGGTTSNLLSAVIFGDANGISFGLNASTITASHNGLTSQSNQNVTAANGGFAFQTLSFSNVNGISFGTSAGSAITASHNALTTARASNDAIGTNTAQTNVTWTVNSAGLSLNASGYAGTATAITGAASITANSAGISFNGAGLAGTTSGFTGGASISGSMTHNTAGLAISLSHPAWITTAAQSSVSNVSNVIAATNNAAGGTVTLSGAVSFSAANGLTFYTSAGNAIVASYTVPIVPTAYVSSVNGSSGAISLNVGSSLSASSNGSSITFGLASNITTALQSAGAYLTTAAQSGHSHGNPTLALTNLTGTTASASNGFTISLSAAAAGGGGGTVSAYAVSNSTESSSGTLPLSAFSFAGAGIASVGVTNGSIVISVPSGGGAGDGYLSFGMSSNGNTAGTSGLVTSGRAIMVGVGPISLSQSLNGQSISLSIGGPAVSSLSATGAVSISINGSTISIGVPSPATRSYFNPRDGYLQVAGQQGQGSLHFQPAEFPNVQFDRVAFPIINTNSSNSSGSHTLSFWFGMYTRNASTLSLLSSASSSTALTHSGTLGSYSWYSGIRLFTIPMTMTAKEGQYYIGILSRTTSGGANGTYSQLLASQVASSFFGNFGSATNQTQQYTRGLGVYTATTTGLPSSVAFSQISGGGNSLVLRQPLFYVVSETI